MAEKCPLCSERLVNGECRSCGYTLPDMDNLSSLYDYEPDNYPQEEPAIREIIPDIEMEEIYPNRPEPPKFKVRDESGKTVVTDNHKVSLDKPERNTYNNSGNQNKENGNPYAGYTPGTDNQNGQSPFQMPQSPFANPSANTPINSESLQAFMQKYWWLVLLSFLFPILGIILYSTMKNELSTYKYSWLVWVAALVKIFLPF